MNEDTKVQDGSNQAVPLGGAAMNINFKAPRELPIFYLALPNGKAVPLVTSLNVESTSRKALADNCKGFFWRRGPESNRPTRICNPVHNRFATAP
jgi:hypothetical protein